MYVQRNSEARSLNQRCSGKGILITHSECLSVSSMQSACDVVCCNLWRPRLHRNFPRYFIKGTIFGGEKMCVLNETLALNISHPEMNSARYCPKRTYVFIFMVIPRINGIKCFIVQLVHSIV